MSKISLGGSPQLHSSMSRWKAQQASIAASQERRAANIQDAPALGHDWRINRLADRGQLDPDWIVADVLRGTAMRLYTDFHFADAPESEVQRERLASFKAATAALGSRFSPTVCSVVLMNELLQTAGERLGYENRSACVAAAKERSDVRSQASGRVRSPAPKIGQSRVRSRMGGGGT